LFALAFASFGLTFALTPAIAPAHADEANLTGTWRSTFTIPNGNSIEVTYKLKQEGGKLTGTATTPADSSAEIKDGEVKDGKVTSTVVRERDGKTFMTRKHQGTLSGDTIKGKIAFESNGESGERDWEARRAPDDASVPGSTGRSRPRRGRSPGATPPR
jgi:hypothetical protein